MFSSPNYILACVECNTMLGLRSDSMPANRWKMQIATWHRLEEKASLIIMIDWDDNDDDDSTHYYSMKLLSLD